MPKLVIRRAILPVVLPDDPDAEWFYIADPHLGHANIIRHCQRPFAHVDDMDRSILEGMRAAEATSPRVRIIVAGDLAFNLPAVIERHGWLQRPQSHVFLAGNHDRVIRHRPNYEAAFGTIVGNEKTWATHSLVIVDHCGPTPKRVLVSHNPLPVPHGAEVNVYGHYHDNLTANPAAHDLKSLAWLLDSTTHYNAGVELNAYRPRRLTELATEQGHNTLRVRIPNPNARRTLQNQNEKTQKVVT
jgi:calcineurin-like phosphoesterase family protein